ncbi:MAG: LSm family protein [Candidatus Diapherotrites archaeon]|nr:LSm family protein [Candidatus Diapherotrites archaeon]
MTRPFDELTKALGKPVMLRLKGDRTIRGVLASFDVHLNIILENAEELANGQEQTIKEKYPRLMVRGDNIIFVAL